MREGRQESASSQEVVMLASGVVHPVAVVKGSRAFPRSLVQHREEKRINRRSEEEEEANPQVGPNCSNFEKSSWVVFYPKFSTKFKLF